MTANPPHVLVLCTGNSARSIMAEALLNHFGAGRVRAWSAGSRPAGQPHPMALAMLRANGIATEGLASKSWDDVAAADAPRFDLVVTVCDAAAGDACPIFAGAPLRVHWPLADPAAVVDPAEREAAFSGAFAELERRIRRFLALPLGEMSPRELRARAQACADPGRTGPD